MRLCFIIAAVALLGCKKVPVSTSSLAVTSSVDIENPENAPGAVSLIALDATGQPISSASGVRNGNRILTSAHTFENGPDGREVAGVRVLDYRGNQIEQFGFSSENVTLYKDPRYKGDQVMDPNDRAAVIFKGGALEGLDRNMQHYGDHKSAEFSTKPFEINGRYRVAGAGPADYAYQDPGPGGLQTDAQVNEFVNKASTGQMRRTDTNGNSFNPSIPPDAPLQQFIGHPYQQRGATHEPNAGEFGVTMPGDSGGPVYALGDDGRMQVVGLTQAGGYSREKFDMRNYPDVIDENGQMDYSRAPGGMDNRGMTYRYPESENLAGRSEYYNDGRADSFFNSTGSGEFSQFMGELDSLSGP